MKKAEALPPQSPMASIAFHLRSCQLQFFQLLTSTTPNALLFHLTTIGIIQLAGQSMLQATIEALSKEFSFNSSVLHYADKVIVVFLSPFVGYYGIRFNRAHLLAFSSLIGALSILLSITPYLIYEKEPSNLNFTSQDEILLKCTIDDSEMAQSEIKPEIWPIPILLLLSQLLQGLTTSLYLVLSLPYIDDTVIPKNRTPITLATILAIIPLGSTILVEFLKFFNSPVFSSLTLSLLALITSPPLFYFPLQKLELEAKIFGGNLGQAWNRFQANRKAVYWTLGIAIHLAGLFVLFEYTNKYIEMMYRIEAKESQSYLHSTILIPALLGITSGGILQQIFKPKGRWFLSFLLTTELIAILAIATSTLLINCEPQINWAQRTNETFGLEASEAILPGYCPAEIEHCQPALITFLIILSLGNMIDSLGVPGQCLFMYRIVAPIDKSFTVGLTIALVGLFYLPATLLSQLIVHSNCLNNLNQCCLLPDISQFQSFLYPFIIAILLFGTLFHFLILLFQQQSRLNSPSNQIDNSNNLANTSVASMENTQAKCSSSSTTPQSGAIRDIQIGAQWCAFEV